MRKFGMLAILLGAFGLTLSGCSGEKEESPLDAAAGAAKDATETAKETEKAAKDAAAKTQPK